MRLIDVFRIAFRMLRTNLLRSSLTILGIGVAISFIVLLIGLGRGLQNITIGSIVQSKALLSIDVSPSNEGTIFIAKEMVERISTVPNVADVSPVVVTSGEITLNGKLVATPVTAGKKSYLDMDRIVIKQGKAFSDGTTEAVISAKTVELFELTPDELLNQTIKVSYADPNNQSQSKTIESLTIVGISSEIDVPALYIPYNTLYDPDNIRPSMIKVLARRSEDVTGISSAIVRMGYQAESLVETLRQAEKIFNWVTIALTIFGAIALIVASIGMFNTLTIALIERTREIGIMKAIGVTDKTVKQLFLAEAGIIGLWGGIVGVGLGLGLDKGLGTLLNQVAKVYEGNQVDLFQYPDGFLIAMVIFPILLALGTGLYPASRASRLNPLTALRYE